MLRDILDRIEERLEALKMSATKASKLAGLSEDAIRNLRRAVEKDDRQGISTSTLELLAPVLDTTPGWLLAGDAPAEKFYVPVIGTVGADPEGRVLRAVGQGLDEEAEAPPGATRKAQALLVRGHSMRGLADDGGLIYFEEQRTSPTPDMLEQVVVVETDTDEVLVKRLLRGSRPGLYDLQSIVGPTRHDARLRWAAHITAIIPPFKASHMRRHATESQVA